MNATQHAHRPTGARRAALTTLALVLALAGSAQAQTSPALDIEFKKMRFHGGALLSGTDNQAGAVYWFSNVATTGGRRADARVTLVAVSGATVSVLGGTTNVHNFEPTISAGSGGGYVDFKFEFLDSANNPLGLKNFSVTGIAIDGTASYQEFQEIGGFSSYRLDQSTQLTTVAGSGGRIRFNGRKSTLPNLAFENTAAYIADFTAPVHTMTLRLGVNGNTSGSARQFSLGFGAPLGTFTTVVETGAPAVVLSTPATVVSGEFVVTAVFDQDVTGFVESDVVVQNGSVKSGSFNAANAKNYSFTVTPAADGAVTVVVPAASARSAAMIDNTVSNTLVVTRDTIAPSVVLSATQPTGGIASLTATFSEPVTGFAASDVTVAGGSVRNGSVSGSGSTYTFEVNVPAASFATVQIAAAAAQDAAGHPSSASNTVTLVTPPTISSPATGSSTKNAQPGISGLAAPGALVTLTLDGNVQAPVITADAQGAWLFQPLAPLLDGPHVATATATLSGATSEPSTATTFTIDTTPPETVITSGPADVSNGPTFVFEFASSPTEPGVTFECSLDGTNWTACTSPHEVLSLTDGEWAFHVRALDALGNADATPAKYVWTVDTTPPTTWLTAAPELSSRDPDPTFSFTAGESGVTFECRIDGGVWFSCTSPHGFFDLPDGPHTFDVRATDAAGNTGLPSDSWTWTIDTTAPKTLIVSGPPSPTNATSATFDFDVEIPESGVTYECSLNGSVFALCDDPSTFEDLDEGTYTLAVRALDALGNADPNPVEYSWTVDTTPPVTTITSGPDTLVNTGSAMFTFTSEDGVRFECSLNGAAFVDCSSPKGYSGLPDDTHTFRVRATDAAGNTGLPSDAWTWTIDTTAPKTLIVSGPPSPTNATSATFDFDVEIPESGVTYECSLNGSVFALCDDPSTFEDLDEGTYTLAVRALDALGNADPNPVEYSWTVDTTPPVTMITSGPDTLVNTNSATFTFTSEDGARFECSLNGAAFADCSSPESYSGLPDGDHTFRVRAIDAAGNVEQGHATHTWTVDTVAPDMLLVSGPPAITNEKFAQIEVSASETAVEFECKLDAAAWAPCGDVIDVGPLEDGLHTLLVRARDEAGNVTEPALEIAWTIDTVRPDTTIDAAPEELVAVDTASFAFGSDEAPVTYECSLDGADFEPCDETLDLTDLSDGKHTLLVRATDLAGNTDDTPAEHVWTVDTTRPVVTITDSPDDVVAVTTATIELEADESVTYECSLDGTDFESCDAPVELSDLEEGEHTLVVRAIDEAGNVSEPVEVTWTIDLTAPDTLIRTAPASPSMDARARFAFESDDATATFECSLDGAPYTACDADITTPALGLGGHTLLVRAVDPVGNTDLTPASHTWTVIPLDSDGDGLSDEEELRIGTDPFDADSDDDGVLDGDEPTPGEDTDGDGLIDALDPDSDNDGILDGTEMGITEPHPDTDVSKGHFVPDADPTTKTDPRNWDTDGDGVSDGDEDTNRNGAVDPGERDPLNPNDPDQDGDGTPDAVDNCPETANADQADQDGDGIGDVCDADRDGDGVPNDVDNCPLVANPGQEDGDGNGVGDVCEGDADGDGVRDDLDNCPEVANADQADQDGDGIGDACDPDKDGDGFGDHTGVSGGGCQTFGLEGTSAFALLAVLWMRRRRIALTR